ARRPAVRVANCQRARKGAPAALGISSGVSAFTTMRPPDFSSTFQRDDPVGATRQRQQLQRRAGVGAIQWLDQVHGRDVIQASRQTAQSTPTADAAWTGEPGLGLAIRTADCAPVVLFAKRKDADAIAAVHCGWRGTVAGIIEHTLAALSTPPERISAWIGPTICPNCYEVDAPVRDRLSAPERDAVLTDGRDAQHWWLDLAGLVSHRLQGAGVHSVASTGLCTAHDAGFYSHRDRGDRGRMATVAWLRGRPT
ncbi:MAG: peptidoglycan editing factor PgeF, partial [Gammaproteobacteria bacterium]|nr:peptidoglycan editing factor PgeF [Gammaproteobacteria bacterium]